MTHVAPIAATPAIPAELVPLMTALAAVGRDTARLIARGPLGGALGESVGENTGGDTQKALDVIADEAFMAALKGAGVRWYASEEQDDVVEIDEGGSLALAIDPLDGSSNIDVNVSIGTIFSIRRAGPDGVQTFFGPGTEQIGAGYIIYGPQASMLVTFGDGVLNFLLDPDTHSFVLIDSHLEIPQSSTEFAINASNYRHWPKPIRAYIDDCLAGAEGPREKNFNMRWIASLVAETHRIMTRGGIFLYPGDDRPGYERGRLRLIYECAPIAMLVEQAGGRASTGCERVLDQKADELHARTPFVFGTPEKVDRVCAYHDLPDEEVSALFGERGLFRA